MVAQNVLARISFARSTPVDYIRPTWDFNMKTPTPGVDINLTNLKTQLTVTFLDTLNSPSGYSQANKLTSYLSHAIKRGVTEHRFTVYSLDAIFGGTSTHMGAPIHDSTFQFLTAAASGSNPLPDEAAAVVSFNADLTGVPEYGPVEPGHIGKSRPAARRRGRLFVGPLNSAALGNASGDPILAGQFVADLVAAYGGAVMGAGLAAIPMVWSRKDGTSRAVVKCHVDSLFDIRNNRGNKRPHTITAFPP
jgi:hypothetical protein